MSEVQDTAWFCCKCGYGPMLYGTRNTHCGSCQKPFCWHCKIEITSERLSRQASFNGLEDTNIGCSLLHTRNNSLASSISTHLPTSPVALLTSLRVGTCCESVRPTDGGEEKYVWYCCSCRDRPSWINVYSSCKSCGSQVCKNCAAATSDTQATCKTTENHSKNIYNPTFITMMGITGKGKSSFFEAATEACRPPYLLDDPGFDDARAETLSKLVTDPSFRHLSLPIESDQSPKHTGHLGFYALIISKMIGTGLFDLSKLFMSWISGTLMSGAFLYLDVSMGLEQPSRVVQSTLSVR